MPTDDGMYRFTMIHMLGGLPRSGSTLLANVLNQHPDLHTSGTSSLAGVMEAAQTVLSNDPTVLSEMSADPTMYHRYQTALRGLVAGFYESVDSEHVLDKGRLWPVLWPLITDLWPTAKLVVTVRDPRDVVASVERQHRATAVFASPVAPMLAEAADQMMSPQGLVGGPIRMVLDLLDRQAEDVVFVRYESFVKSPEPVLDTISEKLGLEPFDFNTTDVKSNGGDADEIWRGKYPHDGTGPIKPNGRSWEDVLAPELATLIAGVYPRFMSTFSYTGD